MDNPWILETGSQPNTSQLPAKFDTAFKNLELSSDTAGAVGQSTWDFKEKACSTILSVSSGKLLLKWKHDFQGFTLIVNAKKKDRIQFYRGSSNIDFIC